MNSNPHPDVPLSPASRRRIDTLNNRVYAPDGSYHGPPLGAWHSINADDLHHASRSNLPHHLQCPRNVAGMWFLRTSFFQVNGQGRGVCGVISLCSLSCYTISFPPIDTHFLQSKRQTDTGNILHYNSRDFLRYDKASLKSLR